MDHNVKVSGHFLYTFDFNFNLSALCGDVFHFDLICWVSGHILPEWSCFLLVLTGTHRDQLQHDDEKVLTDVLTRSVNEELG